MNRTIIRANHDAITPVPNAAGALPAAANVWFLQNNETLGRAKNGHELADLLPFYGLANNGNLDAKRARIRAYVGILL